MKILKKILKITGIVFASIILFMILLVVGAKIFESELASLTLDRLENEIDAPLSIGKVSLIPLFSFPRVSAEINNLWIGEPKSKNNDTLFFINSLKVGLDAWDLIGGIYNIEKVEVSGLDFDYIINKKGGSNIDFLINAFVDTTSVDDKVSLTTDAPVSSVDFLAEKLRLENIRVYYYDSLTHTAAQGFIPEINMKAKGKNDVYEVETKGSFVLNMLLLEGTKAHLMESCTVNFDLIYRNKEVSVEELNIRSEGIEMDLEGTAGLGDTLMINASLAAKNLDFDVLNKYLPDEYVDLFKSAKTRKIKSLHVDANMDYAGNDANIRQLSIKSDGFGLGLGGNFSINDTLVMDASIENLTMNFAIMKNYIPNQYLDEYGITDMDGIADISGTIVGKYADSTLLPVVDADVKLKKIRLQTRDYPEIKTLDMAARITNGKKLDMSEAVMSITKLDAKTAQSSVYLDGTITGITNPQYKISTNLDIKLDEFKAQIPDSLAQNLRGNIIASIKTSGILPEKIPDDFAEYVLDKTMLSINFNDVSGLFMDSLQIDKFSAAMNYSPQISGDRNIQIKDLNLKSEALNLNLQNSSTTAILSGKLSKLSTMGAELQSIRLQNGSNLIVGSGEISNFEVPEFDVNANVFLNLEELMVFTPDSVVKNMSGTIKASIQSKGKIHPDSLETQLYPLIFEHSSFELAVNNVSLAFPDPIMDIDNISTRVSLGNDVLKIDDFSAIYNGLSFEIDSSTVQNIYKSVLLNQKEELYVKIHFKLGDIFYDSFKHLIAIDDTNTGPDNSGSSSLEDEPQNWTFLIHGTASVNSVIVDTTFIEGYTINRLHIDDMSTLFKLTDSTYILDQFKFKAFEGNMNNSFHYKIREDGTQSVSSRNIIQGMNIRTLLRDMDNFGMDSLFSYENISGLFSTDLNTFVPIDDSLLLDKMLISGDIVLEKGGVHDYKPAQEISSLPGLKDLDNLQFKTLRSNIFMFKNKLYVPRTNIVSNALDIAAFGMQSMDYDCQYHLEVHLSNILFGKSNKRNKKQDKSGEEIDEESLKKASHKVRYSIVDGVSKVKRDTKDSREDMMNKIRVQQKMLDFIFFPKNIHYNTAVDKKN